MNAQTQLTNPSSSTLESAGMKRLSPVQGAWIVAEREITTKLRSKAFIISTAVLLLLMLGAVIFASVASNAGGFGEPTKVAVVAETAGELDAEFYDVTEVADRAAAEEAVLSEQVDAALVPGGDTSVGLTVIALDSPPLDITQAVSVLPTVELLKTDGPNPFLAYLIAIAFGVVFMMSAMTFGTTIAQSVVEEKQTRIVEILLATISSHTLLAGKILGNSILAMGQIIAIAAVTSVGMLATGQDLLLGELGSSIIWFAVLFAFGFVLLAAMYAALASLVDRQEDVPSATSLVMWLVMLPYIAIIVFNDNPQALQVMSYIPFSAPVGMPMRVFLDAAQWWEPWATLGILLVTILVVVRIGSRIYARSVMRTGGKVKLRDALRAES